jgi:CHRD domain
MRTARLSGVLAAAAALLLLGAGPAAAEQVTLTASGSGAEEAPDPGQEGATIRAEVMIDTVTGTITYTVRVAGNTEAPAAAHIHQAPRGTAGPVVVPLDAAAVAAGTQATTTVAPDIAAAIAAAPENYYVNAHSPSFPGGFARGQLRDASPGSVAAGDGSSTAGTLALLAAGLLAAGAGAVAVGLARRRAATR